MLFERGDGGEGVGGEVAGAEVAEGVEFFAELEEALFRADGTGAVFLICTKRCQILLGRSACMGKRIEGKAYRATYGA